MKKFVTLPVLTAIFLACALFPQPLWAAVITIGETNILTGNDSRKRNLLIATPVSLSQTATMQSLSFYVSTPAAKLHLGIYDATGPNGAPGAKKAEINEITPVAGWNTANVIAPVSLPAGNYWLAYLSSSNRLAFRQDPSAEIEYKFGLDHRCG